LEAGTKLILVYNIKNNMYCLLFGVTSSCTWCNTLFMTLLLYTLTY